MGMYVTDNDGFNLIYFILSFILLATFLKIKVLEHRVMIRS